MAAYDTFAAAAETNALKVVLEADAGATEPLDRKESRLALSVESRAAGAVDVILRDGGTLRLRPPAAADADALLAFFAGLSERSLYLRFHGIRHGRRGSSSSRSSSPTGTRPGALVGALARRPASSRSRTTRACATRAGRGRVRGRRRQQGRGIGTRLLEQLADARGRDRHRALRRRGAGGEPGDAGRLRRRRLRGRARARGRRGRGQLPDRADRELPGARRGARPRRRRRLAAPVLRAARPSP